MQRAYGGKVGMPVGEKHSSLKFLQAVYRDGGTYKLDKTSEKLNFECFAAVSEVDQRFSGGGLEEDGHGNGCREWNDGQSRGSQFGPFGAGFLTDIVDIAGTFKISDMQMLLLIRFKEMQTDKGSAGRPFFQAGSSQHPMKWKVQPQLAINGQPVVQQPNSGQLMIDTSRVPQPD